MKILTRQGRSLALTVIEVFIVLAIIALLVALLLPMFARGRSHSNIPCTSFLKQVGLAARMWSNDHNERFPWMLSTNEGGTQEFQSTPDVFRHFLVMSNELSSPRILRCPRDPRRIRAAMFGSRPGLSNSNVSYFIGLDADERFPQRILSGDRNLTGGTTNGPPVVYSTNSTPGWGTNIHRLQGNVAFSDGSIQQFTSASLSNSIQAAFATMTNAEMRLAIPRIPGE